MKKITTDINTKWSMLYRAYKQARTEKKKTQIRNKLMELLRYNAMIVKFNHDNRF